MKLKYLVGLLSFLALFSTNLMAKDLVVPFRGMTLTLTHNKCTNKDILAVFAELDLKPEFKDKIFAGKVENTSGSTRALCYVSNPKEPTQMIVVDDHGEGGYIDLKEPGV